MRKFVSVFVAALLICSALPFAVAAYDVKDTAATIEEGVYIIHPADDNALCLGVEGGIEKAKDQGPVELQTASSSETSMFLIRRDRGKSGTTGKDGAYVILSVHSLRAVGVLGIGYSTSGKTNINMTTDSRYWGGVWFLVDAGNGRYSIRCGLKSTTESAPACLGVDSVSNGNNTYVSGNKSTLWTLEKVKYLPKTLEGAGTADDPCQISTPEQLTEFANYVADFSAYRGMHFKLTKDITYNGPKIGAEMYPFSGIFDGDGHTIHAQISGGSYTGLFASLDGATVKNLNIKGTVSGTGEGACAVGAVVGNAYGETVIDNCHVTADVTGAYGNIGGIAGAMSNSTISNCRMDGNVTNTGWTSTGGIVGGILGGGNIYNCTNTGKVTGDKAVGGILGCVMGGKTLIGNCASLGSTAENTKNGGSEHGGIVGFIDGNVESFTICNCFSQCIIGISESSGYVIGNNLGAGQISVESVFYVVNGNAGTALGTGNRINNASIKSAKSSNDTTASSTLNRNVESYNAKGYAFSKWGKNNAGLFPISCAFDANYNVSYASVFSEKNTAVLIVLSAVVLVALVGVAVLYVMKKKKA